jgi:hypothetical protein
MNVGLTRARTSMLVVGCADALKIDKHWSNLVASSQQRRRYFKVLNPWTLNPCTITGNERLKVQRFQDFVISVELSAGASVI